MIVLFWASKIGKKFETVQKSANYYIKVSGRIQKILSTSLQPNLNQSFIDNEQKLLISFRKKRKMFGKEWLGNSKECLIFARSYMPNWKYN
jgi:hypothetical protein